MNGFETRVYVIGHLLWVKLLVETPFSLCEVEGRGGMLMVLFFYKQAATPWLIYQV